MVPRRFMALVVVVVLCITLPSGAPAQPAVGVKASFELDPAPSWQTDQQRLELGSWVKHSSPVVADLDPAAGNGPEIVVGSLGGRLYALRMQDGVLRKVWDVDLQTFIDSSPAVADLDGDGCLEVVVGAGNEHRPHNAGVHVVDCRGANHRFWPAPVAPDRANHVGVFSTPAIGDVNGDGSPEIVYGSFNQRIYVKSRDGRDLPGWEGGRQNWDTVWSSPALPDVDGDGRLEVVIGTDLGGGAPVFGCARGIRGTVSMFDEAARFRPGWPKCIDTPVWSSPAVQDVNGDGRLDVVVATNNYLENGPVGQPWKVRAWDALSGGLLWETTLTSGSRVFSSPAIGDVGGDGTLNVAVGTIPPGNYGEMYLLDARTGAIRWRREGGRHEVCACMFMGSPVIADVSGDGRPEVVAASQDGGVMAWDAAGNAVIDDLHMPPRPGDPDWKTESYMFFNSPAVADVDGDGTNDIVLAGGVAGSDPLRGKVWVVGTPGTGTGPWPMFRRTPDRRATVGTGSAGAGPPPVATPPKPPSSPRTATPRPAAVRTPGEAPAPAPEESQDVDPAIGESTPSPRPLAAPEPDAGSGGRLIVLGAAGLGVLVALLGVVTAVRRARLRHG